MKKYLLILISIAAITFALSSCAYTKSCHVAVSLTPPSISVSCDSLLQTLFTKGGKLIIPPAIKTDKLKASGKTWQEVKIKVNK